MDYSYSNGGRFQPCDCPFYQPPVIVVQVPAYTCTSMQQQDYRPQTRNCTKNTSKTLKNIAQKCRDEQRGKTFTQRKSVCASIPFYNLTDHNLDKCMPKHLHTKRSKSAYASAEIYSLKEQVELLKSSVTKLQTSLSEERERLHAAEEQVIKTAKQNS